MIVENQVALGDSFPARAVLSRLMEEALDRHEAVHAIGLVLSEQLFAALREEGAADINKQYVEKLNRLTAESWRKLASQSWNTVGDMSGNKLFREFDFTGGDALCNVAQAGIHGGSNLTSSR